MCVTRVVVQAEVSGGRETDFKGVMLALLKAGGDFWLFFRPELGIAFSHSEVNDRVVSSGDFVYPGPVERNTPLRSGAECGGRSRQYVHSLSMHSLTP